MVVTKHVTAYPQDNVEVVFGEMVAIYPTRPVLRQ
jgi:hypothetical protein